MPTEVIPIFEARDYDAEILRGAAALAGGSLVVLPTETVYGAAGLLTNPQAKARLQALRGGDNEKPFTIHIPHRQSALHYLGEVGKLGDRLMKKLWPGPVGLMFEVPADRRAEVAANFGLRENDLYDSGNITLRCPDNLVTADVLSEVDGPVVLTIASADAGGPNLKIENLAKELDGKVEMIFDTGPTSYSKPSTLLKITGEKYEIVRAGVYDERIIDRLLKTTILFVCSGNTCRSPMAEAIARKVLADKLHIEEADLDKAGMTVVSAGSYAMPGSRATPEAVDALRAMNIDLSRHRSKPLTVELIHQADAIYTMGRSHLNAVRSLVPSASDKVQTLNPDGEIDDPIGSDVQVYKALAGQLTALIEKRLNEGE